MDTLGELGFFRIQGERLAGVANPQEARSMSGLLAGLELEGITGLVTLTEAPLPHAFVSQLGRPCIHVPVRDYDAPTEADVERTAAFSETLDGTMLIHCRSGIGRTGTMLACILVTRGRSGAEAITEVRRAKPAAINSRVQERFVAAFAQGMSKA